MLDKGVCLMKINFFNAFYYVSMFIFTYKFSFKLLEKYVYYLLVFGALYLSYIIIVPLITWLVTLQSIRLLSYLVSSLIVVVFILFGLYFIEDLNGIVYNLLEITFQCFIFFCILFLILYGFKYV